MRGAVAVRESPVVDIDRYDVPLYGGMLSSRNRLKGSSPSLGWNVWSTELVGESRTGKSAALYAGSLGFTFNNIVLHINLMIMNLFLFLTYGASET